MCDHTSLPRHAETRCWGCGQWYYHDPAQGPQRVLDRERTEATVTARNQTTLILATRYLEAQGHRYLVHFGWENAEAIALSLGYRFSTDDRAIQRMAKTQTPPRAAGEEARYASYPACP